MAFRSTGCTLTLARHSTQSVINTSWLNLMVLESLVASKTIHDLSPTRVSEPFWFNLPVTSRQFVAQSGVGLPQGSHLGPSSLIYVSMTCLGLLDPPVFCLRTMFPKVNCAIRDPSDCETLQCKLVWFYRRLVYSQRWHEDQRWKMLDSLILSFRTAVYDI